MFANAEKLSNFNIPSCGKTNIDLAKMVLCMLNFILNNSMLQIQIQTKIKKSFLV